MNLLRSLIAWFIGITFLLLLFPVSFIVWLLTFPFDKKRKIIHWLLVWQSTVVTRLMPIWKVQIDGREKAGAGSTYIIISNHQSLLDILVINCLRYRFKWVSKIENTRVPVLGWYLRMADYLTVDRENDESKGEVLAKAWKCLKDGTSVMMFPEGTRSVNGKVGYFKRGAFQLAIETRLPILPLVLDGTGNLLPKKSMAVTNRGRIILRVLDPVPYSAFGTDNPEELAAKFREIVTSELTEIRTPNGTLA